VRKILHVPFVRFVCWYLALFLSGIAIMPATVNAAFISSSEVNLSELDSDVLSEVRLALENDLLAERLGELGLSSAEIQSRLDALSPEEHEAVLADMEKIQAGGDGAGALISLAILILLIILIIKLLDKEITIK
jgi:hypothetical protein